jgi:hypothetical protein
MLPKRGKILPERGADDCDEATYAAVIGAALREELGDTHRSVKTVMRWTGASERTVKNWFAGTCGPSGKHLIAIVRHSDAVFASIMLLAERDQVVAAQKLIAARDTLAAMLEIIIDLTA